MIIRRIHIEAYKLFQTFDIEFNKPKQRYYKNLNLSILVGENGTGKTTLLKAISSKFCPASFRDYDDKISKIDIDYEIENTIVKSYDSSVKRAPVKLITSSFAVFDQYSPIPREVLKRRREKENLELDKTKYIYCGPTEQRTGSVDLIIESIFSILNNNEPIKVDKYYKVMNKIGYGKILYVEMDYFNLTQHQSKVKRRANGANYLQKSRYDKLSCEDSDKILEYIEKTKRIIREMHVRSRQGRFLVPLNIFMQELYEGYTKMLEMDMSNGVKDLHFISQFGNQVSLTEMSSGEITMLFRLLPLITEIEDNSIIIIDEPETHLHPKWAQEFIGYLVDLFGDYKVHLILATHSPTIISDVPCECIIGLKKNGNKIKQYKPNDRTLGAASTEVLRDVFEIEESSSKYAVSIRNNVDELLKNENISKEELKIAFDIYNDLGTNLEKYKLFKKHKKILESCYVEE
ncbi:AAA family ATPase [Clostridium estertheticum]|uniref:AAA family ATPase n=1 Tax=Clostridium estertheticum TaxID=238834 RepID=UPI001C0CF9C8|nr:AAA family ATPase [Clostridium estertheticum]MBU3175179.1 AAA family ATPase [Clostridium estertheticum]